MAERTDLIDMMPYWLQRDDVTGDWAAFMGILQGAFDTLIAIYEQYQESGNVDLVHLEEIVDAMLYDLGNPFDVSRLTAQKKRLLVRILLDLYREMGTDDAIRSVVRIFTDRTVTSIIRGDYPYGWELGTHVLGDGVHPTSVVKPTSYAIINPSREFLIYSFRLTLDDAPTDEEVEEIEKLMEIVKPVYMHYMGIAGLVPLPLRDHWELGISQLNLTSDLH